MSSQAAFKNAVVSGDVQTVRRLIDQGGIDVNARDKYDEGRTPIFYAKKPCIMQMLIVNGAHVNLNDDNEWTPLHYVAVREGRRDNDVALCCELLLSNNANILATTHHGNTPLHVATYNSRFGQVARLLTHQRSRQGSAGVGFLLTKTNGGEHGRNALHDCAPKYDNNSSKIARFLVEQCRGEDGALSAACHRLMFTEEWHGDTPLGYAKAHNTNPELVKYLESFVILTLATSSPDDHDGGLAVTLNPTLDAFQRAIATDCLDLIATTTCSAEVPDAAVYIVMGYLSPSDVMKR